MLTAQDGNSNNRKEFVNNSNNNTMVTDQQRLATVRNQGIRRCSQYRFRTIRELNSMRCNGDLAVLDAFCTNGSRLKQMSTFVLVGEINANMHLTTMDSSDDVIFVSCVCNRNASKKLFKES